MSTEGSSDASPRRAGRPAAGVEGVGSAAIIDAACELLKTWPPEKITRAEVARRAGVAPRLIHYYFEDRGSLLLAVARQLSGRFQADARRVQPQGASPELRLKSRIAALLNFHMTYPFFHRLLMEEVLPTRSADGAAILHEMTLTALHEYEDLLALGVASGRMRPVDLPLLYIAVIGMVEMAVAGRPILRSIDYPCEPQSAYAERFADFSMDLLFNGLARATGADRASP